MLSHPIVSHSMSLGLPDKIHLPGVAANVLLAAGAILKPALDSLLISGFRDSSVTTFGGRIGDATYAKGLTLLEPTGTVKGYQHHDIVGSVVPFLRTTNSSMPLSQPSTGVMFGMTACFLSLAAGTFLVRSHANSEPGGSSSTPLVGSLFQTLAYNREQRQAQNGRVAARRRGRREREFSILFIPVIWLTRFILTCLQLPILYRPITIRTIYLLRTSSRTRLASRFLRIIYLSL